MLKKRKHRSILGLIGIVISLSSCSWTTSYNNCVVFPRGGEEVGKELQNIPFEGYEHFWEWLGRLEKLKEELDICKRI